MTPVEITLIFRASAALRAAHDAVGGGELGRTTMVHAFVAAARYWGDPRDEVTIVLDLVRGRLRRAGRPGDLGDDLAVILARTTAWGRAHGRPPTDRELIADVHALAAAEIAERIDELEREAAASAEASS